MGVRRGRAAASRVKTAGFWSVLLQAIGSLATVAAAGLVASRLGLSAQGEFGLIRTWSDALVTLTVLGVPQGLLHMRYRESVPTPALIRWTYRYVLAIAAAVAVGLALVWVGDVLVAWPYREQAFVVAALLPLAAAHQFWRALLLRERGVVTYGAVTAAPAVFTLIALVPVVVLDLRGAFAWALLAAAAASALVSGLAIRRFGTGAPAEARTSWSRRRLWSVSLQGGLQNSLAALLPAVMLSLAGLLGAPLAKVGLVSLGFLAYQMFGVAAAYLAPLLYDRVARDDRSVEGWHALLDLIRRRGVRWAWPIGAVVLVGPWLITSVWPAWAGGESLLSLMAAAGMVALVARLLATMLQARGEYRLLSMQAIARLAIGASLVAACMSAWPATVAVPAALLVAEVVVLGWLLWHLRPRPGAAVAPTSGTP